MRTMRDLPPCGRYWNQKVFEPPGRILTPNPLTSPSHRKTCPVLGACARFTAASVNFFVMEPPTAHRQRFAPEISHGAVWRTMARRCRKIKHGGLLPGVRLARDGGVWSRTVP